MAFVSILHIIICLILIVLVLIQDSKGAMGSSFGGGGSSSSILGPTGAPTFLFKATRYIVIIFALTSLFLTKHSSEKSASALDEVSNLPTQSAPLATPPAETNQNPEGTSDTSK